MPNRSTASIGIQQFYLTSKFQHLLKIFHAGKCWQYSTYRQTRPCNCQLLNTVYVLFSREPFYMGIKKHYKSFHRVGLWVYVNYVLVPCLNCPGHSLNETSCWWSLFLVCQFYWWCVKFKILLWWGKLIIPSAVCVGLWGCVICSDEGVS